MNGLDFLGYAYSAVWIAIFVYLITLGRKASRLEEEIRELKK